MTLTLGDLPTKGYASHGESWSSALALRLGFWAVVAAVGWRRAGRERQARP